MDLSRKEAQHEGTLLASVKPPATEPFPTARPSAAPAEMVVADGLVLRHEGAPVVAFLKEHCVASRVDEFPEKFHASVTQIVGKMMRSSWLLLYESVVEELCFRAKCAA